MNFIDPRTDFGFKRIFGSPRSKPILKSFLNAIIYDGKSRISDLEILDPYQNPVVYDLKLSILDLKVRLDDGTTVVVEMQILPVNSFIPRILYNTAKAYVNQLGQGQKYPALQPVIAVTITDFILFYEDDRPLTHCQIIDSDNHQIRSDHLQWYFVELPKFEKGLSTLETLADQWMFFLRQAKRLNAPPPELSKNPELEMAFDIANRSQLSVGELEALEYEEQKLWDLEGKIEYATDKASREAHQEGLKEGERLAKLAIAQEMLKELDLETVSRLTGLSVSEIEAFQNSSDEIS